MTARLRALGGILGIAACIAWLVASGPRVDALGVAIGSGDTVLVSATSTGTTGNGRSEPSLFGTSGHGTVSADARYVVFQSTASNLVSGDTNAVQDVFVRDLANGTTERVSVLSGGGQTNGESRNPTISADGRYVVFESSAPNLPGSPLSDVYLHDRGSGTTSLINQASAGHSTEARNPAISGDGRYVAYEFSKPSTLSTRTFFDIWVYDTQTGLREMVSVGSLGSPGEGHSFSPSISADGASVAFRSAAALVPEDANGQIDVFVRDRSTGTTELVSVSESGGAGDQGSDHPAISADGRFVAFESRAANIVTPDANVTTDIYVRDRVAATTVRVTVRNDGTQAPGESGRPSISADGRYVAFDTVAQLAPGDVDTARDIYVRDRLAGRTIHGSVRSDGTNDLNLSQTAAMSADGRTVAFASTTPNMVPGDGNSQFDVFLHALPAAPFAPPNERILFARSLSEAEILAIDMVTGTEHRLTNNVGIRDTHPAVSADGMRVAFTSNRAGGAGTLTDIWIMDADGRNPFQLTATPSVMENDPTFSPDGTRIAFERSGDILVMNVDGSDVRNITNSAAVDTDPAWSPDGARIAFVSRSFGTLDEVFVMNPDGSSRQQITSTVPSGADTTPAWSPDSTHIAFTSNRSTGGEVWLVNVATRHETNLISLAEKNGLEPSFSPDGTKIVYRWVGLFTATAGGTGIQRLTAGVPADTRPFWASAAVPRSTLSIGDVTVIEGNASTVQATIPVTLSVPSAQAVSVNFSTADGSAIAGSDYTASSGALTFGPGETAKTITVPITGDTLVEADETFFVRLDTPTGAAIADAQATITIANDDLPALAIGDAQVVEGHTGTRSAVFTLTLSASSPESVLVSLFTDDGTATGFSDYQPTLGSVKFEPGETIKTIAVPVFGDAAVEPDETFVVNLHSPVRATILDGQGTGTILTDDRAPVAVNVSAVVDEDGSVEIILEATDEDGDPIAFSIVAGPQRGTLGAVTADVVRYTPASDFNGLDSFTFKASDGVFESNIAKASITINSVRETFTDGDIVVADLGDIGPTSNPGLVIGVKNATGTQETISSGVHLNDPRDVAQAPDGNLYVIDDDFATGAGRLISVNRATGAQQILVSGGELVDPMGLLVTPTGQVYVADANAFGGAGGVIRLNLAQGTQTLFSVAGNFTQPLDLALAANGDLLVAEAGTGKLVQVNRTNGAQTVIASIAGIIGVAVGPSGEIYALKSSAILRVDAATGIQTIVASGGSFAALRSIVVAANGDVLVVDGIGAVVRVDPATGTRSDVTRGGALRAPTGIALIRAPGLYVTDASPVFEGDTGVKQARFNISLFPESTETVTVTVATADDSATAGSGDYVATSEVLTFAPGERSKPWIVTTVTDTNVEANETFFVNLSDATNAAIADGQGIGTILNDDTPTLSVSDFSIKELTTQATAAVFTVTLSSAAPETVTVQIATADGTALAGLDYLADSATLTFNPGETAKTFAVVVLGDALVESAETFVVNLTNAVGATVVDAQGLGTIVDDDLPPAIVNVVETITVSDSPNLVPAALINVAENVTVSDTPALLPSALITVAETISVTDSPDVFNTPAGTNVVSKPVAAGGTAPVTMTFDNVTKSGTTSLTTSQVGPAQPSGFRFGNPPVYYDLTTTADFAGSIKVCINYTGVTFTSTDLKMLHFENGLWVDRTTSVDLATKTVCGTVASLSPFVIVSINRPPTVEAGGPYSVDEGGTVTLVAVGADPDGDVLKFEWDLDGDGVFETAGASVVFSAADLDGPTSVSVSVRANDGDALSVTAAATVNVVNIAPTLEPAGDSFVDEGAPITFTVTARDAARADVVTIGATDLPRGARLEQEAGNPAQATLHWTPAFTQAGTYSLTLTVADDDGAEATTTVSVTVNETGQPVVAAVDRESHRLSLVDAASNDVVGLIDVERKPSAARFFGIGDGGFAGPAKLYVLGHKRLDVFAGVKAPNPATALDFSLSAGHDLAGDPAAVAITPDGRHVWIPVRGKDQDGIVVLDRATDAVLAIVPLSHKQARQVAGLAFSPDGRFAYVVASSSHNLIVIDTARALSDPDTALVAAIPVGNRPVAVAAHPAGGIVYVVNRNGDNIAVVDVAAVATGGPPRLAGLVRVGKQPEALALSGDGSKLYVVNRVSNNVTALETLADAPFVREVARIPVGGKPSSIAITRPHSFAERDFVYVGKQESNTVSIIDTTTNQVVATIPLRAEGVATGVVPTGSR